MRRSALACAMAILLAASGCSDEGASEPSTLDSPTGTTPETSSVTSSASPSEAASAIPARFPLSAGMAAVKSGDIDISARTIGMRALDFCGRKPLRGLKPRDRLAAETSGEETASTRDLMVFADAGPPAAVLADIRAAATACPAQETGPGSRLLTEVRDSALGDDATTVLHTYELDGAVGIGAEIIDVVRVGRSVLVSSAYAEWDPATNLDAGINEQAADLGATVRAMRIFADG